MTMLDDATRALLQQRLIARMTTIGLDGYPHTVPVWYILDGDDIIVGTGPGSRKVKNIEANPKGSITVGGDPVNDHESYTTGYLLRGDWSLEGEPNMDWMRKIARHYWDDHERVERELAAWGETQALRFKIRSVTQVME
jgi:hypothetical protein